jgi:hypothetical protein
MDSAGRATAATACDGNPVAGNPAVLSRQLNISDGTTAFSLDNACAHNQARACAHV